MDYVTIVDGKLHVHVKDCEWATTDTIGERRITIGTGYSPGHYVNELFCVADKVVILPEEVVQLPVPNWQFFADRGDHVVTVRDIKAEGWKSLYMFASEARTVRDNFVGKLDAVLSV